MNDYLDRLVECPSCHKMTKDGDRIWLNGKCLCPDCYKRERDNITKLQNDSYNDGYDLGYNNGYNDGYREGYNDGRNE